jgi:hypothetical protein
MPDQTWSFNATDAPYVVADSSYKEYAKGDVNANGIVNVVDAQAAYDISNGEYTESGYEEMRNRADVVGGGDGVDAQDAYAILYSLHHGWE